MLSLERTPHYGDGIPGEGFKEVVKTLLCKVSEDPIGTWVEDRTQTLIGMAVTFHYFYCTLFKFLLSFQLEPMIFFLTNSLRCEMLLGPAKNALGFLNKDKYITAVG